MPNPKIVFPPNTDTPNPRNVRSWSYPSKKSSSFSREQLSVQGPSPLSKDSILVSQTLSHLFSTSTWGVLSRLLPNPNADAAFWWYATGPFLAELLDQANYPVYQQYQNLIFYNKVICTKLGPQPDGSGSPKIWKSFMTDDFSPLEFSWRWNSDKSSAPNIRYSVELIGQLAGRAADPFNQETTRNLAHQLEGTFPQTDWRWFWAFFNIFRISNHAHAIRAAEESGIGTSSSKVHPSTTSSDPSSLFLAFELPRSGTVIPKAYFTPIKALETHEAPLLVASRALSSLTSQGISAHAFPAYDSLTDFMDASFPTLGLKFIFAAVDCVQPRHSRLKIYLRSLRTSFDSVCHTLTMGGALEHIGAGTGLLELKKLWHLVLSLPADYNPSQDLNENKEGGYCQTTGMLYYFDVKPGTLLPTPKVYIPVKHYGRDDLSISEGLCEYLKSKGRADYAAGFMSSLTRVVSGVRALGDGRGVQTYISVAVLKSGELDITSYIGPEIYHAGESRACK